MATKIFTNNLNDLLFDVEKVEYDGNANSDYQFDIFAYPLTGSVVTSDATIKQVREKLRVNSCSDRYELVHNRDIFQPVIDTLESSGIQFTQEYEMINYSRFYGKFNINDADIKIAGTNDIIKPRFEVHHSYNGLTKYQITFGWYRLVCSNGLTIPCEEMKEFNLSVKGKHTGKINTVITSLKQKIEVFASNKIEIAKPFKIMGDRWLSNPEERITEVMKAVNLPLIDNSNFNTLNFLRGVIEKENNLIYGGNGQVNDWLVYNAINQYINKNERRNFAPEVNQIKDNEVLNFMVR